MPIYNNIESTDKAGVGFTKSNNAIDKIVTGGSVTNGVLTLDYNDLSTLDIALPVVSSGVSILTQNGSVDITGVDPNCFIDVPALEYSYNGNVQAILSTSFAFVAPDPTNDRLDVISLDPVTNSYIYTQGTPAITPALPTLGAGEVNIAVIYVYGMQPCENSKVVYSAISEQMAEIIIDLTVQLEGVGVVTDSRLAPWDVALQYFLGDVCQIDGVFYKALQNNLGSDPILGSPDWVEIESGGGSYIYDGVAYVDGSAIPATGVVGDISKPFATIKEAIEATPNGNFLISCLDDTPSFGAGDVNLNGKGIKIEAEGKDLDASGFRFVNTGGSFLEIECRNFTYNTNANIFCSGFVLVILKASNKISILDGDFANGCNIRMEAYEVQLDGSVNVDGREQFISFYKGTCSVSLKGTLILDVKGWLDNTALKPFSLVGAGSVISGKINFTTTSRVFEFSNGVLIRDAILTCTGVNGYFFDSTGTCTCIGSIFTGKTNFSWVGNVVNCEFYDCAFHLDMINSPLTQAISFQGDNVISDCEFYIGDAGTNGIYANTGTTEISKTYVQFTNGHVGQAYYGASIVDLGDNDQFPRATKVLDGTEIVKLKVADGDYQEATTQDIADLGGGGGGAKYVADWNVANATSGSAVSGSAYAVLVVPENDVTVTEMETFLTAGAVTTAYVGVYDQAGTTLLGESAIDCNGTGLRSNTLVGGGSFNLVGGTPYWFVLLEGAGAANFASNSALGNVLVAKSGFVSLTPTGLPASIAGFTVATSSMYIGAKA